MPSAWNSSPVVMKYTPGKPSATTRALDNSLILLLIFEEFEARPPVVNINQNAESDDSVCSWSDAGDTSYHLSDSESCASSREDDDREGEETRMCRRTLARAARVSTAFVEPALSTLWKHLRSPSPLLALLRALRNSRREGYWESGKGFVKNIQPKDWCRFKFYARWICTVQYREDRGMLHPSVFHTLARLNDHKPLLPALRRLRWAPKEDSSVDVDSLLTLIPPVLNSLEMLFNDDLYAYPYEDDGDRHMVQPFLETLLCNLSEKAPHLRELHTCTVIDSLQPPLLSVTNLTKLRVISFKHALIPLELKSPTLSALSQLPNLTSLVLHLRDVNLAPGQVSFNALQNLSVSGRHNDPSLNVKVVALLTQALLAPSLASLELSYLSFKRPADVHELFSTLCVRYGASLRSIGLKFARPLDRHESMPLRELIKPLLDLNNLTSVYLNLGSMNLATDEDIGIIASSWPDLRRLSIQTDGSQLRHLPSVHTLHLIVRHCPHLQTLEFYELDLKAHRISDLPSPLWHNLRHLKVGRTVEQSLSCKEAVKLTQFLYQTFPHLDITRDLREVLDEPDTHWTSIMIQYAAQKLRGIEA
ncbi:hypothetical protein OBBRIDRAFT_314327 [Obba rivulosa]|uniref:Uncharacterized protein n=1 Tax=Obba rivulosa TaxID=1052685 RepID=A0A8E2AP50_9APHY|nr:hypothetical protein OBBRIDRAFT_314327 [Obba rivulosa]